jgi:CHAT domain-containing protein/tetratricopeptide (TPR) repeat protein
MRKKGPVRIHPGRCFPTLFLSAILILTPTALVRAAEEGEALLHGPARERPITAEETHVYRVEAAGIPLLVVIEQRGIDLRIEASRPAGQDALATDAPSSRWSPEILVLTSGPVNGTRIEVRPAQRKVAPGRYTIRVEALATGTPEDARRAAALGTMSRGGNSLAAGKTPEAQRQALSAYREAQEAWHTLGELRWEAESLRAATVLEHELGELQPAIEDSLRLLALWQELGEPSREAEALNELGVLYLDLREAEKAREALKSALALWQRLGERFDEGETRSNLCFLEQASGAAPAALACYEEVRALFRELGDGSQEERILNNLGGVYDLLGEPDAALACYEQSLALRKELGDHRGVAQTLNNIAVLRQTFGEWQEALRLYGQVREIREPLGDRLEMARLLSNIGFTYNSLGEPYRALAFLEESLKLRREVGNRQGEVITLNNLGSTWRRLGESQKALDFHQQALKLATAIEDRRQEAITRLRIAEAHFDQGDASAALRELGPALAYLKETGLRYAEAQALYLQGSALTQAGRPRDALPILQGVLERRQALHNRAGEAEALLALATAERALGLHEEARTHAEAAVARVEQLRNGFVSPDLRAAFLATRRRTYSLVIDLLMDRHAADPGGGHDWAALAISEQARARSLLDALHTANAGRAGGAVPAGLLERRQALRRRLSVKSDQQVKQSGVSDNKAEALGREIEALLAELDGVEAEIRRQDPQYAAFSEPRPIRGEEIAGLLDPGTLFLEYSLGEDRSFLWALGAGGLRSFVLPPQREIEDLARQVYEELSTVESGARRQGEAAEALSRILLGPVWSETADLHRLVVVPDAALHTLPFGALPVPDPGQPWETAAGGKPLLEHLELVYVPSATTLALQRQRLERRSPAPKWAAVFADPVFAADDPRLSASRQPSSTSQDPARGGSVPGGLLPVFERLPSSRKEADVIAGLAPAGQVWKALGIEANREAALSGELRAYRVVHFATHGIADTRTPELSGLVLSLIDAAGQPREGFLSLPDIYELDLDADLVVLSGCRTALGKEVRGEGVMGLTRGFLYAGVPRVVASLWQVQDRTTAELMSRFYRALWKDGLSPAAALRKAQRSMRSDLRYRDPYSWAGFVLQGDWR